MPKRLLSPDAEPEPRATLSLSEFTQRMGVHEATGRRWVHSGIIKALRIRRRFRIPVTELDRLLKTAKVKP
jgi:excisionase family DNA binding protein